MNAIIGVGKFNARKMSSILDVRCLMLDISTVVFELKMGAYTLVLNFEC